MKGGSCADSVSGRAPHPLVTAHLLEEGTLVEKLAARPRPLEPAESAVRELRLALESREKLEAANRAAEEVNPRETAPDLYLLLLCLWAHVSHLTGRHTQGNALLRRAKSLVDRLQRPELRAMYMGTLARQRMSLGEIGEFERLNARILELLPAGSPQRRRYLWERACLLASRGRLLDLEAEVGMAAEVGILRDRWMAGFVWVINHFETCQVDAAVAALDAIPSDPLSESYRSRQLGVCRAGLKILQDRWLPGRRKAARGLTEGGAVPGFAETGELLLNRRPEEALAVARREAAADLGGYLGQSDFGSFNLVRAELSCGNAEAGRRIIQMRRRRGNRHYLDGLFLARAALLTGRREEAAAEFAAASTACAQYGAEQRLELELRMACELMPSDLLALGAATAGPRATAKKRVDLPSQGPAGSSALEEIAGSCPGIERAREAVLRYAPADLPVLVTGETGTGKELVARALHECGPRAGAPFIAVNCGAITDSLLESELFGHVRGAFTGAEKARKGLFEEAGSGTLLLDEVSEMPQRLQAALLRVLESGEVRPVGASRVRRVGCRVVAATNVQLGQMVEAGTFRRDLFYRLCRAEILLPALRDRGRDVLVLARRFLSDGRADGARPVIAAGLESALLGHRWPGNVRELRNLIERMRLLGSEKLEYDLRDEDGLPTAGGLRTGHPRADANPEGERGPGRRGSLPAVSRDGDVGQLLRSGRSKLRRTDRLRELFAEHGKLTRAEVARVLEISARTATRDLRALCEEGYIDKVMPSPAPRTHYFQLRRGG